MTKISINLTDIDYDFFGLIISGPSGYIWENKVCGLKCRQASEEGVFIPLPLIWRPKKDPLYDEFGPLTFPEIQIFISASPYLTPIFEPSTIPYISGEAWVPVRVRHGNHTMKHLAGQNGILTYKNSN